jgi:acetate kinase
MRSASTSAQANRGIEPPSASAQSAGAQGIRVVSELFPNKPQVAVFDTAFHQTLPPHAFHYAIPAEFYANYRVRRYGFHGTSNQYVGSELARRLRRPIEELQIIAAHLGNGCSATAVKQGKSVDTTMGLTPLEGLVMGTRSGDVDPSLAKNYEEKNVGRAIENARKTK